MLGSLAELEQLKRGLQTAKLATLMDKHPHLFKEFFLHSRKPVTADFIQDLFVAEYSDRGSNNRVKEEAIMMNWVSYLPELEGTCINSHYLSSSNTSLMIMMAYCMHA